MRFRHVLPDRRLHDHVRFYWELTIDDFAADPQRLIPNFDGDLIIHLGPSARYRCDEGESSPDAAWKSRNKTGFLEGCFPSFLELKFEGPSRLVGVRFRATRMYPFVRAPMTEFRQSFVDLEGVFGRRGSELIEQAAESESLESMAARFDSFLLERLTNRTDTDHRIAHAADFLQAHSGAASIEKTAEEIGLSLRQLERMFTRYLGASPQQYASVLRIKNFLRLARASNPATLSMLALDCGYYDQSHLSRTFKSVTGMTPTQYLAESPDLQRSFHRAEWERSESVPA